ncbi:MAG: ABC transporter permease subunit [Actinobacteria bacterium]|nr:ABC transporter permease subunit [Actinomycetota bacterium]MBU1493587.1 ABC transporter permease subunit [Actinomycetota bacterium]
MTTEQVAPLRQITGGRLQRVQAFAVASLLALAVWQLATLISGGWVPSLWRIMTALGEDATTANIYAEMWITLRRIFITFAAATAIGIGLGVAMGLNRRVMAFFRPIVVMGLAVPDVVYIIVAILVLGTEESSGLIAMVLALIPFVINIVVGGVGARDPGLDEMSAVYRLRRVRYLVDVVGWQVSPALIVATRTCFAFAWKLIVLVEALSQPRGIGAQIYYSFRLLRPDHMIARALLFIVILRLVEAIIFAPVEKKFLGWMQ